MAAKQPLSPFFVSFGAEPFFLDRDLTRLRKWAGRTVVQMDGDGLGDYDLVSACEAYGLDGAPQLVIVDDAQKVKGDKSLRAYIEGKDRADVRTVLAAIVRSEKLPDVWSVAAKKGRLTEHKKFKTWDNNNEVVRWVEAEADRLELLLAKDVAATLYQHVGYNLYRLFSELTKLKLLVGRSIVTREHVRLTLSPTPTAEPWQVADAAFAQDARKALNLLSVLYRNEGNDANVPLVYALMRQAEKMLLARQLLDKSVPEDDIAGIIGMNPWRCKNFYLPQVRKHTVGGLSSLMSRLCQLDLEVKGSAKSKRTLIELTVLSVAG